MLLLTNHNPSHVSITNYPTGHSQSRCLWMELYGGGSEEEQREVTAPHVDRASQDVEGGDAMLCYAMLCYAMLCNKRIDK